jgi:hypothetical protein
MGVNPTPPGRGPRPPAGPEFDYPPTDDPGTSRDPAARSKAPGRNIRVPLAILVVLIVAAIVAALILFA